MGRFAKFTQNLRERRARSRSRSLSASVSRNPGTGKRDEYGAFTGLLDGFEEESTVSENGFTQFPPLVYEIKSTAEGISIQENNNAIVLVYKPLVESPSTSGETSDCSSHDSPARSSLSSKDPDESIPSPPRLHPSLLYTHDEGASALLPVSFSPKSLLDSEQVRVEHEQDQQWSDSKEVMGGHEDYALELVEQQSEMAQLPIQAPEPVPTFHDALRQQISSTMDDKERVPKKESIETVDASKAATEEMPLEEVPQGTTTPPELNQDTTRNESDRNQLAPDDEDSFAVREINIIREPDPQQQQEGHATTSKVKAGPRKRSSMDRNSTTGNDLMKDLVHDLTFGIVQRSPKDDKAESVTKIRATSQSPNQQSDVTESEHECKFSPPLWTHTGSGSFDDDDGIYGDESVTAALSDVTGPAKSSFALTSLSHHNNMVEMGFYCHLLDCVHVQWEFK